MTIKDDFLLSENADFLGNGLKVLELLQQVRMNPANYPILSSDYHFNPLDIPVSNLPKSGMNIEDILHEIMPIILQGYCNVSHPQYYGYISPKPLSISILGDLLASGLNQTPGAWRAGPSATLIEAETLNWLGQFIGYDFPFNKVPNGIFTSGGAMANATAIKLARDNILGVDIQNEGVNNSSFQASIYLSKEGHFSIVKSLDFLGIGKNSLRLIPTIKNGQVNLILLEEQIIKDIKMGCKPFCLVGTAGTTGNGAIDPLEELADLAKKYGMWFHVDAASGGAFAGLPEFNVYFKGLNRADSVTIDPCKWLYVSFGIGCLLVRDGAQLVKNFQTSSHYWEELSEPDFFQMGLPGTRQWRSLGLWMAFKQLGNQGYFDLFRRSLANIHHLATKIKKNDFFELLEDPVLPICCFRVKKSSQKMSLNSLNHDVQRKVTESGQHYLTTLEWGNTTYLRVSLNNYTTDTDNMDSLIDSIQAVLEDV